MVGTPREACLCLMRSHVHALIAETQRFDRCFHLLGCERHMALPRKPKGPTGVSSGDAGLARRPRPGSGYLRRTGSRNPSHTLFPLCPPPGHPFLLLLSIPTLSAMAGQEETTAEPSVQTL